MKYTKKHRNRNYRLIRAKRNATWKKYKDQQNELNADRRGVKNRF